MKGIEVVKNVLAGIGFISFFVGVLFLGGAIDSEGSVLPGVLLILFGLGCAALFIVALSYEEWQIAERNRIRNYVARYGRNVHVSYNGKF